MNNLKLNLAAHKLAADIRFIRQKAIDTHNTCGAEVLQASNTYQLFCLNTSNAKILLTDPMHRTNMVINFNNLPEFSGVAISASSLCQGGTCSTQELRIDKFGVPMDKNNNAFTGLATVTLAKSGTTRTVQVTQETGFTEIV